MNNVLSVTYYFMCQRLRTLRDICPQRHLYQIVHFDNDRGHCTAALPAVNIRPLPTRLTVIYSMKRGD